MSQVLLHLAHSGGFGWDEAAFFSLPLVILVILQLLSRRRTRRDAESASAEVDEA